MQTSDLHKKIVFTPTKRKRTKSVLSRKGGTYTYTIFCKGTSYIVCKEAFLSIHSIGKQRVENAFKKKTANGSLIKDQRGRLPNPNAHSPEVINCIHEHIQSMPVRSSHYTRDKNPNRQYLDTADKKSIRWMHDRYLEWMSKFRPTIQTVKYGYYCKIFSECYNIEFKAPRSDTCDTCAQLNRQISDAKKFGKDFADLEKKLKIHMDKAQTTYDALHEGEDPTKYDPESWVFICMDLQQTMSCPKTSQGGAYYRRQLNVYNFCIYDLQKKESYMCVWNECDGRRGACEIFSCLYKYLKEYVFKRGINYPKNLKIFADNCGGQNKNNYMCLALLQMVHKNLFERVELCFLVPGHSYNACDRAFGTIELRLKRCKEIVSPEKFREMIADARIKKKFPIIKMDRLDFLNIEIFRKKYDNQRIAYIRPTEGKVFQTASIIVMKKRFSPWLYPQEGVW